MKYTNYDDAAKALGALISLDNILGDINYDVKFNAKKSTLALYDTADNGIIKNGLTDFKEVVEYISTSNRYKEAVVDKIKNEIDTFFSENVDEEHQKIKAGTIRLMHDCTIPSKEDIECIINGADNYILGVSEAINTYPIIENYLAGFGDNDLFETMNDLISIGKYKDALDGVQGVQFSIGTRNHFALALESEPLDNGCVAVSVCSTTPFLRHQSGMENDFCDFYLYDTTLIFEPPTFENDKFQFCCATSAEIEEIKNGEEIVVFPPDGSNDFSAPIENMQKAFKRTCLSYLNKDFVPNENIQNALNQAYTEYTKQAEAKADYAEYDQEDEQEQDTDFDFDLD